ncbi:MAG: hypothetical protein K8I29_01425 [Alphaproteobacteria bacterium]|uniref:Uncharacterized protein n=1 Tax=Candidatus Nitrobium versatile TaxID=2884831 RepID=A0A953M089_9BACT|nr:hypothetical protein [Candidatus Nitrobium versatile]
MPGEKAIGEQNAAELSPPPVTHRKWPIDVLPENREGITPKHRHAGCTSPARHSC